MTVLYIKDMKNINWRQFVNYWFNTGRTTKPTSGTSLHNNSLFFIEIISNYIYVKDLSSAGDFKGKLFHLKLFSLQWYIIY